MHARSLGSLINYQKPKLAMTVLALVGGATLAGCSPATGSLEAAASALGVERVQSLELSATGRWYQFGQAPAPGSAWPQYDVSSYVADIDYAKRSAHVQLTRKQTVEAGRERPAPVEQKPDQYVSGELAWNVALPQGAADGAAPVPTTQPAAVEERTVEILSTPQGFVKAALENKAESRSVDGSNEVSFQVGKHRYVGWINQRNEVSRVQTWIDNPVLGDTPVETLFENYKDFNGLSFPQHIVRRQGEYPVLDLNVSEVKVNPTLDIAAPQVVADVPVPSVVVTADQLADGIYYIKGGTHHSVAVEQKDQVVVVEAPQNEARSLAVIEKLKEVIPDKPIKLLVNTHAHFDHSGGLRTYAAEDVTIVTHETNKPYYEAAWAQPRSLNPDRLAQSGKTASFTTFKDKLVLADERNPVEVYAIEGNGHNDAFALVYLPSAKVLIEADAYTPPAAGAPLPTAVNPYSRSLYENIQRLKLDVKNIAALHGPRLTTLDDLRAYIGVKK